MVDIEYLVIEWFLASSVEVAPMLLLIMINVSMARGIVSVVYDSLDVVQLLISTQDGNDRFSGETRWTLMLQR